MVEGNETGEEGSNEQVSKNSVVLLRLAASPSCSSNELVQGSFETSFVSNDFSLSVCLPFLRDNEFSLIYRPSSFLRFEDLVDRRIDTILFSLMFDREIYRVDNFSTVYGGEEERLFGLIRKKVASFAPLLEGDEAYPFNELLFPQPSSSSLYIQPPSREVRSSANAYSRLQPTVISLTVAEWLPPA